jgi:hypothetical protein
MRRNEMKKVISIIAATLMLLSLAGCSGAKPDSAVDKFFSAAKKLDVDAMGASIAPSNTEDVQKAKDILTGEEEDEYAKYFLDYLQKNAEKMEYTITGTETNGDKAVVTVDCKYVDGGPLLRATVGEFFTKLLGMAFTGEEPTEEETNQMFVNIMQEQTAIISETYQEKTIDINCVQQDGVWYIEEVNDDMLDVVLSGFMTVGSELAESLGAFGDDSETADNS